MNNKSIRIARSLRWKIDQLVFFREKFSDIRCQCFRPLPRNEMTTAIVLSPKLNVTSFLHPVTRIKPKLRKSVWDSAGDACLISPLLEIASRQLAARCTFPSYCLGFHSRPLLPPRKSALRHLDFPGSEWMPSEWPHRVSKGNCPSMLSIYRQTKLACPRVNHERHTRV